MANLPARDPLAILGSSLFLDVLSYLPYATVGIISSVSRSWREFESSGSSAIWRPVCKRVNADPRRLQELAEEERLRINEDEGDGSEQEGESVQ
jgi:hypothetical protein